MENKILIVPESKDHWLKLRHQNVNSTEVSALFGCNPYVTEFELWHQKRVEEFHSIEESEPMRWGSRLQNAIAYGVAADRGWTSIREMKEYIYNPEIKIGSSFDFCVNDNEILEIKNVSERVYAKSWSDEEGPAHIELQLQCQMLLSGFHKGYLAALVGGNSLKIIERKFMPAVGEAILKKVKHFWERSDEPRVDFERDAEFISLLYQNVDPNKVIQADDRLLELATRYNQLSSQISLAEQKKEATKAEILTIVRDAEKVRHEKFTISLGMTKESVVKEHIRAARRGFRLTMKVGNEQN